MKPGQIALDGDAATLQCASHRPHEPDDGVLRQGVHGIPAERCQSRQRGGDDDVSASGLEHRREHGPRAEDDTVDVDAHDPSIGTVREIHDRDGVLGQRVTRADTGVQDGDTEGAVLIDDCIPGNGVSDVERGEGATDLARNVLPGCRVDVADDHVVAAFGQSARRRRTDATGPAGDDRFRVAHPRIPAAVSCLPAARSSAKRSSHSRISSDPLASAHCRGMAGNS